MQPLTKLAFAALVGLCSTAAASAAAPQLMVAGRSAAVTPAPAVRGGLLVGPWGACARLAGAAVEWQAAEGALCITSARGRQIRLRAGGQALIDGVSLTLPGPAVAAGEDLVAPLKPLCDALDTVLEWNAKTLTARVWGRVVKLEARGEASGVAITVVTSLPAQGRLQTMRQPRRAFIDLPGTYLGRWPELTYLNECGVLRLRCAQHQSQPPLARVVADLREGAPGAVFERRTDGCGGRLLFGRPAAEAPVLGRARPALLKITATSAAPDTTAVTAFLTDPVEPAYDVLRQPYRVLLDLPDTVIPEGEVPAVASLPFLAGVKLVQRGRLALYMNELVPFTVKLLEAPDRVQVLFRRDRLAGKKIMVDAGHGGKDSGARGRTLLEKDINLDVAQRTVTRLALLEARPYLTRDTDVFIDLYARPRLTNELPADLFVSIHCNAAGRRDVGSGTGTYYCHPQSKGLAVAMQDALAPVLRRRDGGVHQARFCVVRETQIPAVLVELLFIDNAAEEALLGKPETRQAAAFGICEGLRRYLEGTSSPTPPLLQPTGE